MRAIDRASRGAVHALLRNVRAGRIELAENFRGGATIAFGPAGARLRAGVLVRDPRLYRDLLRSHSIALGEGYGEGRWTTDEPVELMRILAAEVRRLDGTRRRFKSVMAPFQRLATLGKLNTRRGARRNVAAHYDLGNEMFEAFLDRGPMMYSAALYSRPGMTLEQAQEARLDRVCEWLELGPGDHLLEIGSGWGGMAIHAARRTGCRVTTTTISREQREYADARVREAGLGDRIEVIERDYRDLEGRYDKLVSLEMIEAVGWEWFETYFRRCSELLKPDGLFFLQAIVIEDGAYEIEKRTRSFANQVIFPGGCLPSAELIERMVGRATDMREVRSADITDSYALTLAEWRRRFEAASAELEAIGYDDRFRRLWSFYLAFSEGGFRERRIRDLQLLLAKPGWAPSRPEAGIGSRRWERRSAQRTRQPA